MTSRDLHTEPTADGAQPSPDSYGLPAPQWTEDILGAGFYSAPLPLGDDPDGEGEIEATLVAYQPHTEGFDQRRALLWVHGMTDYFFNAHVARHYHELGYAFYALDLRKCGRSRKPGQSWHYISDLRHYYVELDKACQLIPNPEIIPIGHSTGGLICALWLSDARPEKVAGLILDGPWLDMMGVPRPVYKALIPVTRWVAKVAPGTPFPGGNLTAFGDSMHVSRHGEWDYDLTLKPLGGHKKYVGWLNAIVEGFEKVHSRRVNVRVPYLTICSTRSVLGEPYSEDIDFADAVVDVNQTIVWAPTLGAHGTLIPIYGARHEAFASKKPVREEVFSVVDRWLKELP